MDRVTVYDPPPGARLERYGKWSEDGAVVVEGVDYNTCIRCGHRVAGSVAVEDDIAGRMMVGTTVLDSTLHPEDVTMEDTTRARIVFRATDAGVGEGEYRLDDLKWVYNVLLIYDRIGHEVPLFEHLRARRLLPRVRCVVVTTATPDLVVHALREEHVLVHATAWADGSRPPALFSLTLLHASQWPEGRALSVSPRPTPYPGVDPLRGVVPFRRDGDGLLPVPQVIHVAYPGPIPPPLADPVHASCIHSQRSRHPGWTHRMYDTETQRRWISEHAPEHLDAWSSMPHDTERATLFRYMVLEREGGISVTPKYLFANAFHQDMAMPPAASLIVQHWARDDAAHAITAESIMVATPGTGGFMSHLLHLWRTRTAPMFRVDLLQDLSGVVERYGPEDDREGFIRGLGAARVADGRILGATPPLHPAQTVGVMLIGHTGARRIGAGAVPDWTRQPFLVDHRAWGSRVRADPAQWKALEEQGALGLDLSDVVQQQ